MFVVDASVAVLAFGREPMSRTARTFLSEGTWRCPDVFLGECANALTRLVRMRMMTATIARSAFDALSTLAGEPVTTTSFVLAAFQKSLELNHSVFACLYLETARSLGARFVTLDSRFLDKLRQTADETLALHLSDWRPEAP